MKAGDTRIEWLTVKATYLIAGRLLVVDPDFAVLVDGWKSCFTKAAIKTQDGESFDWLLALELSPANMHARLASRYSVRGVIPCFQDLAKDAVPIGARIFVDAATAARLAG